MKKKDQNQMEKKKKQGNPQKEKKEEKQKDKKIYLHTSAKEKENPLMQSSNIPKTKKNNILIDVTSQTLTRKKSEQKYNNFLGDKNDKNIKKEKPRVFSHSPDHLPNQNNQKINDNKAKTLYKKNLTERKFTPANKNENYKSPNNLKVQKQNINKKDSKENATKKNVNEEQKEDLKDNAPQKKS